MSITVFAAFEDKAAAESAAGALLDHGVRTEDISLIQHGEAESSKRGAFNVSDTSGEGQVSGGQNDLPAYDSSRAVVSDDYSNVSDISAESNTGVNRVTTTYDDMDVNRGVTTDLNDINTNRGSSTGGYSEEEDDDLSAKTGLSTTTPEDATAGAAKGAAVGLGVGAVAALASLFIPGIGLVTGGGALAMALAGVAASTAAGALAGGLVGYLKDQGVDEATARDYADTVNRGGAILAIKAPSGACNEEEVIRIVEKYGGSNVNQFERHMVA